MNEFWFQIKLRSFPRPVVVLDVSTAASGLWPVLASTIEGLAENLPADHRPDVAFLGSTDRIPLDQFLHTMDDRFIANRGRGRVVGPLFDSFRGTWPPRVVVIAARSILDLADWSTAPLASRVAIVRIDPTVSVGIGRFPEIALSDVESIARLVAVPPASVRVRGGMPVAWDSSAYRFESGDLVADSGCDADVCVGFLTHSEKLSAVAELIRPGLGADRLPVTLIESPTVPDWRPLTSAELSILDSWRGGRAGYCSRCRGDHKPGSVPCPDGGWAFPSLTRLEPGAFAHVRVRLLEASFQPSVGPAFRIGEGAVVHRTRDGLVVWRFDPASLEWHATREPWGTFERIESGDEFALALPITPIGNES